jgi:hypothetical protein
MREQTGPLTPQVGSYPTRFAHRRSRLCQLSGCALVVAFLCQPSLHAQDRPSGSAGRLWMSAGVGVGRQQLGCPECPRTATIGGLAFTAGGGVTLPGNTGVALVAHRFTEISFEHSQQSRYLLILGQYDPSNASIVRRVLPGLNGVTINAGLGHGRYWGDDASPYEHRGSGLIGSAGIGLRVPAGSLAALSVSASYLAAFTGTREEQRYGPSTTRLRPRMALITASISLAGRSPARQLIAKQ